MSNFPTPAMHLKQEYESQKQFFELQPAILQRFLESQAAQIATGLLDSTRRVRFSLPDRVVIPSRQVGQPVTMTIPEAQRNEQVSVWLQRSVRETLLHRLNELEQSSDQAISGCAALLRFATAVHLVSSILPDGRSVSYRADSDEAIPSIPVEDRLPESAITQAGDAIVETGAAESGRGELQTPFVPDARRFFLPQWVAFDLSGKLLVGSEKDAEAHVQSMQRYVQVLHRASSLAPYMVACDEYQRKRYGILGQLINQGRALANFKTAEIIREIEERAEKGTLNRGLSISMPYFDDQNLVMDEVRFEVIPAGRIMFVPAFVVRASRGEQAKVNQDTRLSTSTRKHVLAQLKALEAAFLS
jgi:hypothetical protein